MKLYITGGPGSGKTTYAKMLSRRYNVAILDLDTVKWDNTQSKKFQTSRNRNQKIELLNKFLTDKPDWICEGVYTSDWIDDMLKSADKVIIIQAPLWLRQYRCIKRQMPIIFKPGAFRALISLLRWSHGYDKIEIPKLLSKLHKYGIEYEIIKTKNVYNIK